MYNVVFHEGSHLTTNAVQLCIHDCKPLQHIWPVQLGIAVFIMHPFVYRLVVAYFAEL